MIQAFAQFAKRILNSERFASSKLSRNVHQELLTAFSGCLNHEVVMIRPLIKLIKNLPGKLLIDDTSNPKYGLKEYCRKLKILTHGGYQEGFKILVFLWECELGRIPIGFALWHKGTPSLTELVLSGLSLLRNTFKLTPEVVIADGAFSTDKIILRLEHYGWPCVMRCNSRRTLNKLRIDKLIGRGYGSETGRLKNGAKVKIYRRGNRFFICNRMTWSMEKAMKLYKRRWKIEEVFRTMKQCLGLNRCQQHSMRAQAIYLLVCFTLFTCLELHSSQSVYQLAQSVISGRLHVEKILDQRIFKLF
jgi:hypothetical protein